MPPRRAVRPTGAPTVTAEMMADDDMPTRDELLEAIANLRRESDRADDAIRAARSRSTYEKAWIRWNSLADHLENMCAGVQAMDELTAEFDN